MANAKRKCPYCQKFNRIEQGYLDTGRNRVFCDKVHFINYGKAGSLKTQERRAIRFIEAKNDPNKTDTVDLMDKPLSHHWELTRKVAQKAARLRDTYYNRPCITCGKHHPAYDGGHYKTAKAQPELQLHLWNINAECKHDNWWNDNHVAEMEVNIIQRYGKARLTWLNDYQSFNPDHRDKQYLKRYRRVMNKYMKRWQS